MKTFLKIAVAVVVAPVAFVGLAAAVKVLAPVLALFVIGCTVVTVAQAVRDRCS